jgi:hypothetical protein
MEPAITTDLVVAYSQCPRKAYSCCAAQTRVNHMRMLMFLLAIVPPPACVYYAAIPLTQYLLPSQLSLGHDAEETSHGPCYG